MNNISRDLNPKGGYTVRIQPDSQPNYAAESIHPCQNNNEGMRQSLDYIGMINRPQNSPNAALVARTQKSVQDFLKNPEMAAERLAFEDELMASGYAPLEAMEKAEMFFKALKDSNIYKS